MMPTSHANKTKTNHSELADPNPVMDPSPTTHDKTTWLPEFKLPASIPEEWLNQLKSALKESRKKLIITTVLSSSLLTGALTGITNYYLESRKSTLQVKADETKKKLQMYDSLNDEIGQLNLSVNTALVVLKSATSATDKDRSKRIKSAIDNLLEHMTSLQTTLAKVNDDETKTLIQNTLRPVGPEVMKINNMISIGNKLGTEPLN